VSTQGERLALPLAVFGVAPVATEQILAARLELHTVELAGGERAAPAKRAPAQRASGPVQWLPAQCEPMEA
jgi:hypothetical protein